MVFEAYGLPFVFPVGLFGLLVALLLARHSTRQPTGQKSLQGISLASKDGAEAVLKRQYNPAVIADRVSDAVGDPAKDAVGSSLHILLKLLATSGLVLAPLFS